MPKCWLSIESMYNREEQRTKFKFLWLKLSLSTTDAFMIKLFGKQNLEVSGNNNVLGKDKNCKWCNFG